MIPSQCRLSRDFSISCTKHGHSSHAVAKSLHQRNLYTQQARWRPATQPMVSISNKQQFVKSQPSTAKQWSPPKDTKNNAPNATSNKKNPINQRPEQSMALYSYSNCIWLSSSEESEWKWNINCSESAKMRERPSRKAKGSDPETDASVTGTNQIGPRLLALFVASLSRRSLHLRSLLVVETAVS